MQRLFLLLHQLRYRLRRIGQGFADEKRGDKRAERLFSDGVSQMAKGFAPTAQAIVGTDFDQQRLHPAQRRRGGVEGGFLLLGRAPLRVKGDCDTHYVDGHYFHAINLVR
ncbi:hypothetical protein [Candidatus Pantoea persica]|uniref:hypothetical protein n=1 Tax=Candidatus Pantoea persica TaxID=2518128 RepID=UPI00215DA9F8|nr:hypothetical protein [Candidatus Pantoea persica]